MSVCIFIYYFYVQGPGGAAQEYRVVLAVDKVEVDDADPLLLRYIPSSFTYICIYIYIYIYAYVLIY